MGLSERICWLCFFGGLLAFWPMSWLGFFLPKYLLLSLAVGGGLLLAFWRGEGLKIRRAIFWLLVAYFGVLTFYTIFSIAPWSSFFGVAESMQGLMTQLLYLGFFCWGLRLDAPREKFVVKGLIVVQVVIGIYALLQWLGLDPLAVAWDREAFLGRSFSVLGNPNWLGAVILLLMPLNLQMGKWLYPLLLMDFAVLLVAGSKVALFLAVLLAFWLLKEKVRWQKLALGALVFAALSALALNYFYPQRDLFWRSFQAREIIWSDTAEMLAQWPWGHGLSVFRFVYPQFESAELLEHEQITVTIDNPHNQPLNLLFESGPAGLVIFYLLVALIFWRTRRRPLVWGSAAYLASNLVGFETIVSGSIFWLFLGLMAREEKEEMRAEWLAILGVGLIFWAFFSVKHFGANFSYERGQGALARGEVQEAVAQFEAARSIYPYDRLYDLAQTEVLVRTGEGSMDAAERNLANLEVLGGGRDAETAILRALLAEKNGDTLAMEKHLARSFEKGPYVLRNHLLAIELFEKIGDTEREAAARENLRVLLKSYLENESAEKTRLFWKNYPWMERYVREERTENNE